MHEIRPCFRRELEIESCLIARGIPSPSIPSRWEEAHTSEETSSTDSITRSIQPLLRVAYHHPVSSSSSHQAFPLFSVPSTCLLLFYLKSTQHHPLPPVTPSTHLASPSTCLGVSLAKVLIFSRTTEIPRSSEALSSSTRERKRSGLKGRRESRSKEGNTGGRRDEFGEGKE